MGLGTRAGGVGVARYLAEQGAEVTVTDLRPPEALGRAAGGSWPGFRSGSFWDATRSRISPRSGTDMIVRNPGVPRRAPLLELARSQGVPIEMEMCLFFRACPAPLIGVTGTKGKTTVSTLHRRIAALGVSRRRWWRETWASPRSTNCLDSRHDVPVVIELSSWQLESLIEHGLSPHIAVLTNISEDHLNPYDGFADYAETKRGIARHQRAGDWLVVNATTRKLAGGSTDRGPGGAVRVTDDRGEDGAWLSGGRVRLSWQGMETHWPMSGAPALRGHHGVPMHWPLCRGNARARGEVRSGRARARGVPRGADRMELVSVIDGVTFVNDTAATAPSPRSPPDALSRVGPHPSDGRRR